MAIVVCEGSLENKAALLLQETAAEKEQSPPRGLLHPLLHLLLLVRLLWRQQPLRPAALIWNGWHGATLQSHLHSRRRKLHF